MCNGRESQLNTHASFYFIFAKSHASSFFPFFKVIIYFPLINQVSTICISFGFHQMSAFSEEIQKLSNCKHEIYYSIYVFSGTTRGML